MNSPDPTPPKTELTLSNWQLLDDGKQSLLGTATEYAQTLWQPQALVGKVLDFSNTGQSGTSAGTAVPFPMGLAPSPMVDCPETPLNPPSYLAGSPANVTSSSNQTTPTARTYAGPLPRPPSPCEYTTAAIKDFYQQDPNIELYRNSIPDFNSGPSASPLQWQKWHRQSNGGPNPRVRGAECFARGQAAYKLFSRHTNIIYRQFMVNLRIRIIQVAGNVGDPWWDSVYQRARLQCLLTETYGAAVDECSPSRIEPTCKFPISLRKEGLTEPSCRRSNC